MIILNNFIKYQKKKKIPGRLFRDTMMMVKIRVIIYPFNYEEGIRCQTLVFFRTKYLFFFLERLATFPQNEMMSSAVMLDNND